MNSNHTDQREVHVTIRLSTTNQEHEPDTHYQGIMLKRTACKMRTNLNSSITLRNPSLLNSFCTLSRTCLSFTQMIVTYNEVYHKC